MNPIVIIPWYSGSINRRVPEGTPCLLTDGSIVLAAEGGCQTSTDGPVEPYGSLRVVSIYTKAPEPPVDSVDPMSVTDWTWASVRFVGNPYPSIVQVKLGQFRLQTGSMEETLPKGACILRLLDLDLNDPQGVA